MELTANAIQTVKENGNILFTDTVVKGNCSIVHREGSGLITLRGITDQCRARYRVFFGGNIAIPSTGSIAPISMAIAVNGEPVATTTMISTPGATDSYNNIFSAIFLDVPKSCCYQISVENTSNQIIEVQNANIIIERVA